MPDLGPMKIKKHGYSQRRGLPTITGPMMDVMNRLRDAHEVEEPWQELDDVDQRTIKAILTRKWMDESGRKYKLYKINEEGLKALKVYGKMLKRYDGICPTCGERPKHVTSGGKKEGYCKVCLSALRKRQRALGIQYKRPDSLCPRCVEKNFKHKRTRHVTPGGWIAAYCKHCLKVIKRRGKRKAIALRLQRVLAGEFVKCRIKDCNEPVTHTDRSQSDLCARHLREYMNDYNKRRRPDSHFANSYTSISVNEVFERYPFVGTVEHLPWILKADGLRYFNWRQVASWARQEVPCDAFKCEPCNRKPTIEMVCPEGYAIYRCPKCNRRFRVVLEFNYFLQEDL